MVYTAKTVFRKALLGFGLFTALSGITTAQTEQSALSADETYALARDAYLYAYPLVLMDSKRPLNDAIEFRYKAVRV